MFRNLYGFASKQCESVSGNAKTTRDKVCQLEEGRGAAKYSAALVDYR